MVVIGAGPIGLCVVQILIALGAKKVAVIVRRIDHRARIAAALGAILIVGSRDPQAPTRLPSEMGRIADVAHETSGDPLAQQGHSRSTSARSFHLDPLR